MKTNWWHNEKFEKEIYNEMGLKLLSMERLTRNYALLVARRPQGEEVTVKAISLKRFFKDAVFKQDVLLELEVHSSQSLSFINLIKYIEHKYLKNLLVIVYENYAEKSLHKYFQNINKQGFNFYSFDEINNYFNSNEKIKLIVC